MNKMLLANSNIHSAGAGVQHAAATDLNRSNRLLKKYWRTKIPALSFSSVFYTKYTPVKQDRHSRIRASGATPEQSRRAKSHGMARTSEY